MHSCGLFFVVVRTGEEARERRRAFFCFASRLRDGFARLIDLMAVLQRDWLLLRENGSRGESVFDGDRG